MDKLILEKIYCMKIGIRCIFWLIEENVYFIVIIIIVIKLIEKFVFIFL